MKKLILLAAILLAGCDSKPDNYSTMPTLDPARVQALHKVCASQPGYNRSWAIIRDSGAKSVMCRYQDFGKGRAAAPDYFTMDAKILEIKIQEGLKK